MKTECTQTTFEFQGLGRREIVGSFEGAEITSDAGALLLRETEPARWQQHRDYPERFGGELAREAANVCANSVWERGFSISDAVLERPPCACLHVTRRCR